MKADKSVFQPSIVWMSVIAACCIFACTSGDSSSDMGAASSSSGMGGAGGQGGAGGTGTGGGSGTGGSANLDIGLACPLGTECTVDAPFCLSDGIGDGNAYCTKHDCSTDADCPSGYECGITRDPHEICGVLNKGNSDLCGKTNEPCIDPATFGQGNTMFEGSMCILRNTCVKRLACAPCTTDADCSLGVDQRCVDIGGEQRCARNCGGDGDCSPAEACLAGACAPRFGACKGQGDFCQPCTNDTDCGDASTMKACASVGPLERACLDYSFPTTCTTDNDCPTSPSGKHGECFDEGEGYSPGNAFYHRCYLPYDAATNIFSCW